MERTCFVIHLKPERVHEYLQAHERVWPEMIAALQETGWRNFTLFVRENDGLVVGYVETDDYARATSELSRREINTRWQATMSEYFESGRAESVDVLAEYFHLG